MKRKFKLFATVASLCLCLALMAFGVYAASSVEYTINGSVKFEIADVFVDIDYTYSTKIDGTETIGTKTVVKSYSDFSNPIANGAKLLNGNNEALEENSVDLGLATFKKVGDYAEYVINITNKGENKVKASITLSGVGDSIDGLTIEKKDSKDTASDDQLKQNGAVNYTLRLELAKLTYDINLNAIKFVVKAEKGAA